MSLLLYAAPSFLFIAIFPATLTLFALRRASGPPNRSCSVKTTDFYATLLFGIFTTISGVFGLVAESQLGSASRWWTSAAFTMRTLGIVIAQLAVIQLLTPDYLFGLLSINTSTNTSPPLRIYALILLTLFACTVTIISVFAVPRTPSLLSSIPTLISLSLPVPLLFSLTRIVKLTRSRARAGPPVTAACAGRNSKYTDFEFFATSISSSPETFRSPNIWGSTLALQIIAVFSVVGEVTEGALGYRTPIIRLLSAIGIMTWGGGVMIVHFIIIYKPTYRSPMVPSVSPKPLHDLERVADQPSEDFMTLKDPFASPTQPGFCLPPSPPRTAPHRRPRRRASEPLQLKRFGSFAILTEDVKEKQAGAEEDQHTQFLEELVRHAWFSTGRADSDSIRNNAHKCSGPPSTLASASGRSRGGLTIDTSTSSTQSRYAPVPSAPVSLDPSPPTRHSGASCVVLNILTFFGGIGALALSRRTHSFIRIYTTIFARQLRFWDILRVPASNPNSWTIETVYAAEITWFDAQ